MVLDKHIRNGFKKKIISGEVLVVFNAEIWLEKRTRREDGLLSPNHSVQEYAPLEDLLTLHLIKAHVTTYVSGIFASSM
jgi:hypothetical protein